mgnify:CR=1 FL=1
MSGASTPRPSAPSADEHTRAGVAACRALPSTRRTLEDLGWPQLRAVLAELASSEPGQTAASELPFLADVPAVERALARIEEMRTLLREQTPLPLEGTRSIDTIIKRLEKGAILESAELLACLGGMQAARRVRRFLLSRKNTAPALAHVAGRLTDLGPLISHLDDSLEPSGGLKDSASDALAEHRRKARGLHRRVRERVENMVNDPHYEHALQDRYFSVRNDRYVLPVKASFRAQVPGIVHNASQTGQTIFVEPQEVIELDNELAIAEALAAEEERRILAELSEALADRTKELAHNIEALAQLDVVQAAARLAERLDAEPPQIHPAEQGVQLRQLRHPLLVLQGKSVIANDVAWSPPARALVISGPNAGGKTVTLSAVGLCALMLRAGLPIPAAAGSALPLFDGVAGAIGDAQDLSQDLSTFSAHLERVRDILRAAGPGWLALVDEIAADTDPREGAALARAILEGLVEQQCATLVTTHLDEVKALGAIDARFANARVGLDPKTLQPTYALELGAAGVSSAFGMAERLGLPDSVLARARGYLHSEGALAEAIEALHAQREQTRAVREQLQTELDAAREERDQMRREQADLAAARKDVETAVRTELHAELEATRKRVSEMIAELQESQSMSRMQAAQRELDGMAERAQAARDKAAAERSLEPTPETTEPRQVREGTWVRVPQLGQDGQVQQLRGQRAVVAVGPLRTQVRVTDLVPLATPPAAASAAEDRARQRRQKAHQDAAEGRPAVRTEDLDVRGMRAEEAVRELERHLDECFRHGPSTIRVVHGHGSGALKHAVRQALEQFPYVAYHRPGGKHEGGDGVTIIELKE